MMTFYDLSFPAFFLRVYPSGKRTFCVRFQHQGLRQLHIIGDAAVMPLAEAKALAKAKVNSIRHHINTDVKPAAPTLSVYAKSFFPDYARHWKPSTLAHSQRGYWLHIDPVLGATPIDQFRRQHVERWFAGMVERQGTANRLLPVLSVMMQQAESDGYRPANSNPCRHIRRYTTKAMERYLTADELHRLWCALDNDQSVADNKVDKDGQPSMASSARMVIRLLLLTGCRSSEVRTLTWSCYRCGHWYLRDSKTGAKTVFLSTPVRHLLKMWPQCGKYLFLGTTPDTPLSVGTLRAVWQRIRQQAQLSDVRLHDLRHTYASIALQQHVSLLTIARLLGHALPETTLKYAHLAKDTVQAAAEHVSAVLAGGTPS